MKLLYLSVITAALAVLSGCNGKPDSAGANAATVPVPGPTSGTSPDNTNTKGILPSPSGDAPPAAAAAGPAAGHTAVGGMAGGQAQGGGAGGGAAAPTAGDGATSKPAAASK
jgi:hypothetical protein